MKDKITILVTGADGQVGKALQHIAANYPQFYFIFANRLLLNIDDAISLKHFFETTPIDFCINAAAYTAVDRAETESEIAFRINADAVGNLAVLCNQFHVGIVHLSTDYVFDGTATSPISEQAYRAPINVYGASKKKGEDLCWQNCPGALVVRTSWVYASWGNNFVRTIWRLLKEKEQINVVNDQWGLPTNAVDLAEALMWIIQHWSQKSATLSVLHYCNAGEPITWFQFAEAIKEIAGLSCIIHPIPSSEYPTPAKRTAYSALDNRLIQEIFELQIPHWKSSLQKAMAELSV